MAIEAATLLVNVKATGIDRTQRDLRGLQGGLQRADKQAGRTGRGIMALGKAAKYGGAALGVGLVVGAKKSIDAFAEAERIGKQTEAVLKSTGKQAGVTKKQVEALASAISRKTGIDDEAVQASENLLLTFTKIHKNTFPQTTRAVADLATAMNHGAVPSLDQMHSASIQVGKAMNDPIKGVTALQRVGVSFTKGQKAHIQSLVDQGKTLQAQRLILKELNTEFGGSAAAAGETFSGSMAKARNAVENLAETIGAKLAPSLGSAVRSIATFLEQVQSGTGAGGRFAASMSNAFNVARAAVGSAVAAINGWLQRNRAELQQLGDSATKIFRNGIVPAFNFMLAVARRVLPGVLTIFRGWANAIRGIVNVIAGILTLDFGRAWAGVKQIFKGGMQVVIGVVRAATGPFREAASRLGPALLSGVKSLPGKFLGLGKAMVRGLISGVKAGAGLLKDAVLSIIPTGVNIGGVIKFGLGGTAGWIGGGGDVSGSVTGSVAPGTFKGQRQSQPTSGPGQGARKRRGGRFAGGGLVPALMSPGEALRFPGGGWGQVPGTPTAADNVPMSVPVGTEVYTGSGQQMLAAGASRSQALSMQAPHFAKGGFVKPTKVGASMFTATAEQGGYKGDLNKHPWSYAELSKGYHDWSALGGLAHGHRLAIGYGSRTVVAGKHDIGQGGGDVGGLHRSIDLLRPVASYLHLPGLGVVTVQNTRAPEGTKGKAARGGARDPDGPTRSVLAGRTTRVSGAYRPNLGDESEAPGAFFDFRGRAAGLLSDTLGSVTAPKFKTIGTRKAPTTSTGGGKAKGRSFMGYKFTGDGVWDFGMFLQSLGYNVGENPHFGGVGGGHGHYPPRDHFSGAAIDVTGGNLNALGTWAMANRSALGIPTSGMPNLGKGTGVLWQVPNHYDHVHISFPGPDNKLGHYRTKARKGGRFRGGGTVGRAAAKKKAPKPSRTAAIFSTINAIGTAGNSSIARVKGSLTTLGRQLQSPATTYGTLTAASRRARRDIGRLRADRKLTPREKVQIPRLEKAMGLIEGEIRNRVTAPGVGAAEQIEAFDDTGFQDTQVVAGIDPESAIGRSQRATRARLALSSLQAMVPGLETAYARAQATGNPALIKTAGDALSSVRRGIVSEQADIKRLETPAATDEDSALADAIAENTRIIAEHSSLLKEDIALKTRIATMTQTQGPALVAAVVAAVNNGLGGKLGLGTQTPGFAGAGGLARY